MEYYTLRKLAKHYPTASNMVKKVAILDLTEDGRINQTVLGFSESKKYLPRPVGEQTEVDLILL